MRYQSTIATISLLLVCSVGLQAQTLDTTTFVVVGEGLAAGMGNFGLSSILQKQSFPAQMAEKMNTAFIQPLIQPPGIGDVIGYPAQEVRLQTYPQGSVREFLQPDPKVPAAPPLFVLNLSIPGFTLADSLSTKPSLPIAQKNMKQTVVNMILGFPQLFFLNAQGGGVPLWNQFEYAKAMFPTMAVVELGYYEALDAAVNNDPTRLPSPTAFAANYTTLLSGLRGLQAQVIATTIPNPIDTAYFNSPAAAASITSTVPFVITAGYKITLQDYVTRNGLMTIAYQFGDGAIAPLPAGSIMTAATAADLTTRINALNAQIVAVAKATGAVVYDLNAYMHKVKVSGVAADATNLNADYLGGFYTLDGVYPSATGHALIANDMLAFLNTTYKKSFPLVNVKTVAASDTAMQVLRPKSEGEPKFTAAMLGIKESAGGIDFGSVSAAQSSDSPAPSSAADQNEERIQ